MPLRYALMPIALLLARAVISQDTLFYANGKFVTGRVEEVGVELVRYRTSSGDASVLIVAEKRDLQRIKLQGGQEFILDNRTGDGTATEEFLRRKQIVSLEVLAPALNHLVVGYERSIGSGLSVCGRVGYIGILNFDGYTDDALDSKGGMVALGIKFLLPPNRRRIPSARDQHPLAGWYLRPELFVSAWERHYNYYYSYYPPVISSTSTLPYTSCAINLTIGRQLLLGERITFDIHGGLGYGLQWYRGRIMSSNSFDSDRQYYAFSHLFLGDRTPLTISGGLSFGYAF